MIKNKFFMLITIGFLLVVTGCSTGETEPVDQAEDIEGLEVIEELPTELRLDLDDYLDLLQQNSDATIEYDNVEKVNVNGRVWAELTGTTEGYPLIQRVYVANKRAYV